MPPIAFLVLVTIALLLVAALRLELDFRRAEAGPASDPGRREPEPPRRRPELRAPPAGGYWQAPFSRAARSHP